MTNTTAADPVFVKALRLLQSKSKDSTAQLRTMLEDAIAVRRGYGTPRASRSPTGSKETSRSVSRERTLDAADTKEAEKRKELDRLKADLSQLEPKRARLDSPALSNSSPESPGGSPAGSESSQGEFGELQMNIELDCTCIVCKSFNQEISNKLMECSSCQNLYHQECHDPPVSNTEASDPRLIWNCSRCTRKPAGSSSSSRSTSVEKTSKQESSSKKESSSSKKEKSSKHSSSSSSHKSSKHHKSSMSRSSSKHKSGHSSSSHSSASALASASSGQLSSVQMTEAQKRLKLMKKHAVAASMGKKKNKL